MSPLFQPPLPPCVKCGTTTVVAPAFQAGQRLSWFDAQRADVPVRTRSIIAPYASGEPDHGAVGSKAAC
jgi:Na+-translocating ferredoxin:NAD+ oxidoreductase RnfC subunit